MPRPKLTIPVDLDWCDNVLFRVPIKLIPMVGGLLEYLEWPASWVEPDREGGFQIALELERRLIMSECENPIATALQAIASCLCLMARGGLGLPEGEIATPTKWPDYDETPSTVVYNVGDPPVGVPTWAAWLLQLCQGAQWLVDSAFRLVSQVHTMLITMGTVTWGAMVGILVALGISAPVGILAAAVSALAVGALTVYLDAQKNWLQEHRNELICAIYTATTAQEARDNINAVFNEHWTALEGDRYIVELCFYFVNINMLFNAAVPPEYRNEYEGTYCEDCQSVPGLLCDPVLSTSQYSGTFTPYGDFAAMGVGPGWPDCPLGTQTIQGADLPNEFNDGTYDVSGVMYCRSGFGPGATVGYLTLLGYNTGTSTWETICPLTFTTDGPAMSDQEMTNIVTDIDMTVYSSLRVTGNNQPASCREDPGPGYVLEGFCFVFTPSE